MLKCIIKRIREQGFGIEESERAYELCGSYAVAVEYLKLLGQAVARYKMVHGEKVAYETRDYVNLAKENAKKDAKRKLIRFVEEGVNGNISDTAEVWVAVECNMSSKFAAIFLKEVIEEIKMTIPAEDWNTDNVVQLALQHVFGKNANYETILYDFEVRF